MRQKSTGEWNWTPPFPTRKGFFPGAFPLRAVGEGLAIASLCPSCRVSDAALDALCRMAAFVEYGKHSTCAPIALLDGYWLTMAARKQDR